MKQLQRGGDAEMKQQQRAAGGAEEHGSDGDEAPAYPLAAAFGKNSCCPLIL